MKTPTCSRLDESLFSPSFRSSRLPELHSGWKHLIYRKCDLRLKIKARQNPLYVLTLELTLGSLGWPSVPVSAYGIGSVSILIFLEGKCCRRGNCLTANAVGWCFCSENTMLKFPSRLILVIIFITQKTREIKSKHFLLRKKGLYIANCKFWCVTSKQSIILGVLFGEVFQQTRWNTGISLSYHYHLEIVLLVQARTHVSLKIVLTFSSLENLYFAPYFCLMKIIRFAW